MSDPDIHYHADTADLPWVGSVTADCHTGLGLLEPVIEDDDDGYIDGEWVGPPPALIEDEDEVCNDLA